MTNNRSLAGSPWHTEFLRTNDDRRHKRRCVFYEPLSKICVHTKSFDYNHLCRGSSHCAYYSENPSSYFSQYNGMLHNNKFIPTHENQNSQIELRSLTPKKNNTRAKRMHKKFGMKSHIKINNTEVVIGGKFTHKALGLVTLKKIYGDVMLVAISTGEIKRLSYMQCTRLKLLKVYHVKP